MCGESTLDEVTEVDVKNPIIQVQLPEGIILQTDRVGESFTFTDETRVGETVRFRYSGGSEDGERNVLVVKVDSDSLEGLTLERDGGYRKYTDDNIHGDILVVEPFVEAGNKVAPSGNVKRVRFDDAVAALVASLEGEQLAELYGRYVATEGDGTTFDADTGEVVVMLPAPANKFTVNGDNGGPSLTLTNKNGKLFHLYLYDEYNEVGIANEVTGLDEGEITPEQLIDELVKFLA